MEQKYAERLDNFDERNHQRLFSVESCPRTPTKLKRIQLICYNFLERPSGILSISYHFTLFGLVIVGLIFLILETMAELKDNSGLILSSFILEMFLLVIFTSEYILRMWSAGCRTTYFGILGRLRFSVKPFVIVDLVVIASTLAVIVNYGDEDLASTTSILRFFQVLRMVRFDRQGGSWKLLGSVLFLHRQELLTTFYIGFCSLIFASFFVYQAESVVNASEFETFADSFWWGVVTLTTVGYGDKVPKSWAGRGVAAFFAIMGISFFALPAGILGSGFALKVSQQQRQKHVKRRRRPAAMLIQCNWRYYAARKNSKLVATWSPYVRYLQDNASKKDDHRSSEKTCGHLRSRKISIFGRKVSGFSSDGMQRGDGTSEPARHRNFNSVDSLHDGHYSTADQHTDEDQGKRELFITITSDITPFLWLTILDMPGVTSGEMELIDWLRRVFSGPLLSCNGPALSRNGLALAAIHYEMKNREILSEKGTNKYSRENLIAFEINKTSSDSLVYHEPINIASDSPDTSSSS